MENNKKTPIASLTDAERRKLITELSEKIQGKTLDNKERADSIRLLNLLSKYKPAPKKIDTSYEF